MWRRPHFLGVCILALYAAIGVLLAVKAPPFVFVGAVIFLCCVFGLLAKAGYLWPGTVRLGLTDREAAEEILANFPERTIVRYGSRVRWLIWLSAGVLFASLVHASASAMPFSVWIPEAILGLIFIPLFLLSGPSLVVDAEGFVHKFSKLGANKKTPWIETTPFDTEKISILSGTNVVFHRGRFPTKLSHPDSFSPETIVWLMNAWRDRALKRITEDIRQCAAGE